ncbi:diguanylate cyclase domain-containing protein [Clostridium weizhouense]|uniref:Diguanylate cyclase n=1 Tax=Clostridium weizhouense TaxID=2859781 RepID=A0ABS7ARU2_9CLOT|nr:diguanylate cyclase [Clostridium weizhouense]MBW6410788.1 diguanylate cyclase [Clostridium weizhouense]
MNIRKKFIILFIFLITIPTFIITGIFLKSFNKKYDNLIKQNIITAASEESKKIEDFFNERLINMRIITDIYFCKELLYNSNNGIDYNKEVKILNEILWSREKEQDFLDSIILINKNKEIVSSSNSNYLGKTISIDEENLNILYNNKVIIDNIILEEVNDYEKNVIIALPIYDEDYQGAIINLINIEHFRNIVNSIDLFKTGKVSILNREGDILFSKNRTSIFNINDSNIDNTLYKEWKNINFDEQSSGIITYNIYGVKKIGYYDKISDTDWTVLSSVEESEFKTDIEESIKTVVIFILVGVVLIIIANIFIINYFSNPLYSLLATIKNIKQGNYNSEFTYNKNNEFGEIAKAFNALIDKVANQKKELEYNNKKFESLISNIPGGVNTYKLNSKSYELEFISNGYLNILGYTEKELRDKFNNKILNLVYEKDYERIQNEIRNQIKEKEKFVTEYRIVNKDKKILWIFHSGQIVHHHNGETYLYTLSIDITKQKTIEEELRLSEERYSIIMSQTEDIIFQWNIDENTISYSDNWWKKFKYDPITRNVKEEIDNANIIHKDDMYLFKNLLKGSLNNNVCKQVEIRARTYDDNYSWFRIRISTFLDKNGNLSKVIGVIIDINEEKNEAERLLFKAERDSLTHLYNKGTVERNIQDYIENQGENKCHALLMIDIDDFKLINDNLGHLSGDEVLSNISLKMSEVFSKNDIIGRIGGDEFIAFLKDVKYEEDIDNKAKKLVCAFKDILIEQKSDYKISGSIGISKYPKHGKTFKELFKNADKALYLAKEKGKDNYYKLP